MKRRFSAQRLHKVIGATVFVVAALIALIGVTQLWGGERTASEATRNAYCAEHRPSPTRIDGGGRFTTPVYKDQNCNDVYAAYQQVLAARGAANLVLTVLILGGYGVARLGYKYLFPVSRQEASDHTVKSAGA